MNNTLKTSLLSAGTAVLLSASASAATLTFNDAFSWVGSGGDTLVLSQFDDALGTLTDVTVEFFVDKKGGLAQADNDSLVGGSVSFTQSVTANFSTSDVSLTKTDFTTLDAALSADSISGNFTLDPTTGDDVNSFNNTGLGDYVAWTPTDADDLSSGSIASVAWTAGNTGYIGTGSFSIGVSGVQSTSSDGLGGVQTAQVVSNVTGYAKVTYTYEATPVPEPSAFAAIFGFVALGFVATRRRR